LGFEKSDNEIRKNRGNELTLFIIYQNPSRSDDKGFIFLKDGFNWLAFLLPPLWALVNRLWLPFWL